LKLSSNSEELRVFRETELRIRNKEENERLRQYGRQECMKRTRREAFAVLGRG
jgi:hypothetical protein